MSIANKGKNNFFYGKKYNFGKHHSKNTKDKISKANSGENNGQAKLNFKIADEIRIKYATGNYTKTKLAKEYNVGRTTVNDIVNNLRWNI